MLVGVDLKVGLNQLEARLEMSWRLDYGMIELSLKQQLS